MLEGEGSIPIRDDGFSPLRCDTDDRAGCQVFFQGAPVCSPSLRYALFISLPGSFVVHVTAVLTMNLDITGSSPKKYILFLDKYSVLILRFIKMGSKDPLR